ncbi:MAG TPA: YgcG family protein [Burkholderiales bacterium]|nr:YgcG family protein [Burkholderiales bacterium]
MRLVLAALIAFGFCFGTARAEVPVPPLKARVTDLTGTFSAAQRDELEARIAAYETKRGSQMAVLMLPTTKPEEIEQYSIRVAEAWKIGRKKVDDGLILVVAKDDRTLRIEVGYGLEGVIPDSMARRVIDERIVPRFRAGDFYGGVRDGVDQLIRLAEGEKLPPPPAGSGGHSGETDATQYLFPAIIFIVVVGSIFKAMLGRFPGSLVTGLVLGAIAWFLFGLAVSALAAILGFILSIANVGRGGGWVSGGGYSGGSSSSSSWGGGGGGGFGGGGASGRW